MIALLLFIIAVVIFMVGCSIEGCLKDIKNELRRL